MLKSPVFISLGCDCQPAYHLALNGLREAAYPFDWTVVPFDSLYSILENDFNGFFDKAYITDKNATSGGTEYPVINAKFNTVFPHEFKNKKDFENNFKNAEKKYCRRIQRFYETIKSGRPVFFIRHKLITKNQAMGLDGLIQSKFPGLKYGLFIIGMAEEIKQDWKMNNVLNYYIKTAEPENALDSEYNDTWTAFFSKIISDSGKRLGFPNAGEIKLKSGKILPGLKIGREIKSPAGKILGKGFRIIKSALKEKTKKIITGED